MGLLITFQSVLERIFLDCKTGNKTLKRLASQGSRERIYNYKLQLQLPISKINALRKGKSGPQSQKEACLKFSHTEENVKTPLSLSSYTNNYRELVTSTVLGQEI